MQAIQNVMMAQQQYAKTTGQAQYTITVPVSKVSYAKYSESFARVLLRISLESSWAHPTSIFQVPAGQQMVQGAMPHVAGAQRVAGPQMQPVTAQQIQQGIQQPQQPGTAGTLRVSAVCTSSLVLVDLSTGYTAPHGISSSMNSLS